MKNGPIVVSLAGVIIVMGIARAFMRQSEDGAIQKELVVADRLVQVDDLAAKPEDFNGEVILTGAVAGVNEVESVFAVIDVREFKACSVVTCAKYTLPVTYAGKMPQPKTIVKITGQVVSGEKGLLFEAKRVEVVP